MSRIGVNGLTQINSPAGRATTRRAVSEASLARRRRENARTRELRFRRRTTGPATRGATAGIQGNNIRCHGEAVCSGGGQRGKWPRTFPEKYIIFCRHTTLRHRSFASGERGRFRFSGGVLYYKTERRRYIIYNIRIPIWNTIT